MSRLRTIPYVVLSAGVLAGGSAYAQSMYDIDRRQDYQQNQIERGIRDGQITRSEAYRLEQGERAIDRAQARARADGVVTSQERARIDRMVDREGHAIYRESHDNQQAWDRGQSWGHTDGRYDGWHDRHGRRYASSQDGWGQNRGSDRDGDRGNHYGWTRGEHNGGDGNRPPGVDRHDGQRDYADRRYDQGTPQPGNGSHNWGGWGSRDGNQPTTMPTTGLQSNTGSRNWGGWGSRDGNQPTTMPATSPQPSTGSRNWGGWHTQQAYAPPSTQSPTMMRASAPSGGTRSWGGRR